LSLIFDVVIFNNYQVCH